MSCMLLRRGGVICGRLLLGAPPYRVLDRLCNHLIGHWSHLQMRGSVPQGVLPTQRGGGGLLLCCQRGWEGLFLCRWRCGGRFLFTLILQIVLW